MHPDDLETLSAQRICSDCVAETFLSALIKKDGSPEHCAYCGEEAARCARRSKFEPPGRLNIEPGLEADFQKVGCG